MNLKVQQGVVKGWGSTDGVIPGDGDRSKKDRDNISVPNQKISEMIVASIEQICPDQAEWLEQCKSLRRAESLATMVWIAMQMGLWLARGILETELEQRAQRITRWSNCKECGRKMQSKGIRERPMATMIGSIY